MPESMNNLSGKEWLQYSFSIWRDIRKNGEETQLKHPAMFPSQLAERLIRIYTREDGEAVLDPFMGTGSTLVAAYKLKRKGIGVELKPEYVTTCKKRLQNITSSFYEGLIRPDIFMGDSQEILKNIESETVDLCINSPPYWDILNQKRTADKRNITSYSDSSVDLGNIADYNEFLSGLRKVYGEVFRVLKPNKRCCVVLMDIRKKNKFYPFHIDLTRVMTEIGFELEDFIIWDRQHEYNNMRTLGYPWVFRVNKVHEFICIYLKPRTQKAI
jgi:DNA modification methylase